MAKTKTTQEYAAQIVTRDTGVEFESRCRPLEGWGSVDKQAVLKEKEKCYLFLETEDGQKHPCTNVVKLWPYLEANSQESVILVQVFFQDRKNRDSSRGRLGPFIARKMGDALNGRFRYCQLVIDRDTDRIVEGLNELRSLLRWKPD